MGLPDQVTVAHMNGYDFGIGINYATGGPMQLAVTGGISTVVGSEGAAVMFQVRRVHSTSELEKILSIDVEAEYGVAAFGAGASARFEFARSANVQFSSLVMIVSATVELAFRQIDEVFLTPVASADTGQPNLFENKYGNMFVRGVTRGGLFIGYLRIDTGSSELSEKISGELEGSYGLVSGEADSKFKDVQRKYRRELAINMYYEGGPVDLVINDPKDPMELLRNVKLFLESFAERPDEISRPYSVTFSPLTIAHGPTPPNEIDLQNAQDVLVMCARLRSALIDKLNAFQTILLQPSRFDIANGADIAEISRAAEAVQFDLDLIAKCGSLAMRQPLNAKFLAVFAESLDVIFPQTFDPILPVPKPIQPLQPNSMPNFVGRPALPVVSLLACVGMESVDHCIAFLGSQVDALADDVRPFAEFFFVVFRSGAKFDIPDSDPNPPGAVISAQFPPEGVVVPPDGTFTFTYSS